MQQPFMIGRSYSPFWKLETWDIIQGNFDPRPAYPPPDLADLDKMFSFYETLEKKHASASFFFFSKVFLNNLFGS